MKLSIVSTIYESADHLENFYSRMSAAAVKMVGDDFELILVNDGSTDKSLDVAIDLVRLDRRVILLDLSRNFGHHNAIMEGLAHAQGDKVFLIDSDLEEDPDWLILFEEKMRNACCDVVYGVQKKRRGGWFERCSGRFFYVTLRMVTRLRLPADILTVRMMSRRYVDALLRHQERELFLAGIFSITGFDQQQLTVSKKSVGNSTYTFTKKLSLFVNAITSFSDAPLKGVFYSGLAIFMLSSCFVVYLIFNWLGFGNPPSGWTSILASVWLLGGLMISTTGVLGIYLSKIFNEVKQRPRAIVREQYSAVEKNSP